VPSAPWRHGGITWLTAAWRHGSWTHLLGNAYFLARFGRRARATLGGWRRLAVFVAAVVAGTAAHGPSNVDPDVPLVDASAGISGLMLFPRLRHARARFFTESLAP
jgi:membrane associated rhomboid family serine protease